MGTSRAGTTSRGDLLSAPAPTPAPSSFFTFFSNLPFDTGFPPVPPSALFLPFLTGLRFSLFSPSGSLDEPREEGGLTEAPRGLETSTCVSNGMSKPGWLGDEARCGWGSSRGTSMGEASRDAGAFEPLLFGARDPRRVEPDGVRAASLGDVRVVERVGSAATFSSPPGAGAGDARGGTGGPKSALTWPTYVVSDANELLAFIYYGCLCVAVPE